MSKFKVVLLFFFCSTLLIFASVSNKLDQDRFSREYNPDSVYEYRTHTVTILNRGEEPHLETITEKERKVIYYENNLSNTTLTFVATIIYFIIIGYIIYRRKTYSLNIVIFVSLFTVILIPLSFYTLSYNIKELYIRSLGIEVQGKASYYGYSEPRKVLRGRVSVSENVYTSVFNFWYIPKDSIKREFSGKYTQLNIDDLNSYSNIVETNVAICLSIDGKQATIKKTSLQNKNIYNIIIYTFILIVIVLFYMGIFDKPLKIVFDKIDFKHRKKDS